MVEHRSKCYITIRLPVLAAVCVVLVLLSAFATGADRRELQSGRQGLSAQLTAKSAMARMGEPIEFSLRLSFSSENPDTTVRILNRSSWKCFLTFTNPSDGQKFRRYPYDVGMPPIQRLDDLVHLGDDPLATEVFVVHLLSEDGEQIPPGE